LGKEDKWYVHFDIHVVTSDDGLTANGNDLDFHINHAKRLGADVDLGQSRIDCLVELAEA
jgi:hypothetical protein